MVAHEAALVFIVVGAVLGGGCCLKITVLWVRKWLRGRRNNLGLGSALKEVVLQELDNFREPMGGWDQDTDDDEVVVKPTETATRANVPVTVAR